MARLTKSLLLIAAILLTLSFNAVVAQQHPKRLILKDGSYQTVTKWEIAGDRVRYYSSERYDWEEVPNVLVDWQATDKYNNQMDAQRAADALEAASIKSAGEVEAPVVAPGLRLPSGGGVFLLDTYQNQQVLAELVQNGGELNKHTSRNVLRAAINPLALSSEQTVELEGEHAKVQSHVTKPDIYVNIDPATASGSQPSATSESGSEPHDRFQIARLDIKKKGVRVVANLNVAVSGKISEKGSWIHAVATPLGDWVKVSPLEPLPPGEYAVVELLDKGQVNLNVWDFGVNPSAPANSFVWTARPAASDNPGIDSGPGLEKRPK
ncbi:MAG TPA: hypothetical protein VIX19_06790 [Terriglobales bacterium]